MKSSLLCTKKIVLVFFFSGILSGVCAQSLLTKNISLDVSRQRLDQVLEIISNKGNFYFSYNSSIIPQDSLVTMAISNKPVREVLNQLFPSNYEFRESGNYIIIRKAPIRITLVTNKGVAAEKYYLLSGYVLDDQTAQHIQDATVYEKNLLVAATTNAEGYFKLKLKQKNKVAELTVSKEFYDDTTVFIQPGYNQEITITMMPVFIGANTIIAPEDYLAPEELKVRVQTDSTITEYTYVRTVSVKVERTAVGKFLLSSKQRIQSLNLNKFFTERPFQVSVIPGVSSRGKLAPQVMNNVSFNLFGGYNGGVNGVEVGGLFNINKKYVQYAQFAGILNITGGHQIGFQSAGISNTVLDRMEGVQVAGISNFTKGKFKGVQAGGIYNHAGDSLAGLQVAGIANYSRNKVSGSQIAGVANFSNREITGVQLSGVFNYTKRLRGVQIGLINVADTSSGFSIGLINIILKGYHKLSFSTDEVVNINAAFKTGNTRLYSILKGGINLHNEQRVVTFGYGIGKEWRLGKIVSINPEITAQYLYLGNWDHTNLLGKINLNATLHTGKYFSIFAGPVFNVYYSDGSNPAIGYKSDILPKGFHIYELDKNLKGWFGYHIGINFF
jgi:hypothetical protein